MVPIQVEGVRAGQAGPDRTPELGVEVTVSIPDNPHSRRAGIVTDDGGQFNDGNGSQRKVRRLEAGRPGAPTGSLLPSCASGLSLWATSHDESGTLSGTVNEYHPADSPSPSRLKLSAVIPARNEEGILRRVVEELRDELRREAIPYEIVLINDNSTDRTPEIADKLALEDAGVVPLHRRGNPGFGRAIRDGLARATGDTVVIVMGDGSDDPKDVVAYHRKLEEGYDCVFGSRFIEGALVRDYPPHKLFVNRLANTFLRCLFLTRHNDITNAFKGFRRHVIEAVQPLIACHFNITIEIPLKAMIRGFSIATVPIRWYGREAGVSKLKIREMGRKYLFVALYVWLERRLLSDEVRPRKEPAAEGPARAPQPGARVG
jgi:dolichol-phosphate mannosyltransferase